jgi:hypothetical protein
VLSADRLLGASTTSGHGDLSAVAERRASSWSTRVVIHSSNSRLSSRRRVACGGRDRPPQLGETALAPQLRAQRQALIKGDRLQAVLTIVRMRTNRTRCATSVRRSRVLGSGIHNVGKRSCLRRSRRCRASRRSVFVFRTTMARIFAASPTRTV